MKKFIRKTAFLLSIVILILVVADVAYTCVYNYAPPRNKTQYILRLENRKIDYVFLGSSRVRMHVRTDLIQSKTGKKALNLGIYSAQLDDIYLQLKLLHMNKVTFEKVFIQVDDNFNSEKPSLIAGSESLPYIRDNQIIKNHLKKNNPKFYPYYYIPFYRYQDNDFSIGFRVVFLSIFDGRKLDFKDGFEGSEATFSDDGYNLPDIIARNNKVFNAINTFCSENRIEVVYFCAPYSKSLAMSDFPGKLKRKIPGLRDYSRTIPDNAYFTDRIHLNRKGAELFTQMLIRDCMEAQ